MKQIYANNFATLALGRKGENLARQVVFDVRDLESLYGPGDVEVIYQRPGDAQPYPLAVQRDGTLVTWDVTATDTEMSNAYGKCELRYYVGETLAKSKTWRTWVEPAMGTPSETTPPEPEQGWVEQVLATGVAAQQAADAAKADADRAATLAAEVAVNAAQTAQDASKAANAMDAAQTAQRLAEEAQSAAEAQANAAAQSASGAAQSAQEAAESAAVYDDVVADVNQLKQDVATITPDDAAVDGKPWTSKKIVDSLCMTIEETGNPVQVYPVENYPLGVKVSWEPVQEGEGDPSPDNIRPITGRDAVSVTRCGRNILDLSNAYVHGYNITGIKNFLKPNTTYSYMVRKSGGISFAVYITNNPHTNKADKQLRLTIGYVKEGATQTFTTPADMKEYPYFVLAGSKIGIGDIYPDVEFQLELGTTATPYEPYTGSTTDIALPETVYGGTLDVETGVLTVDRGITIADGTTNKFRSGSTWSLPGRTSPGIIEAYRNNTLIISSHFNGNLFSTNKTYEFIFTYPDKMTGLFSTIDELNAYLVEQNAAGTPVKFVYKLATPYTIQLSPQQIAALSGVNTIYTDADGVIVTGAEDPKHTITELKNVIISLGGNI